MEIPNEFFTVNSFATLSGSSAIVFIVTSVIKYLTDGKYNPKWLAFFASELVACLAVWLSTDRELVSFIIGLLNGMLIFATALGINTVVASPQEAAPSNASVKSDKIIKSMAAADVTAKAPKTKFFTRW